MKKTILPLILIFTFLAVQQLPRAEETDGLPSRAEQEREIRKICSQEAEVLTAEEAAPYVKECIAIAKQNLNWGVPAEQLLEVEPAESSAVE